MSSEYDHKQACAAEFADACSPPPNVVSDPAALEWWRRAIRDACACFLSRASPKDQLAWLNELARLDFGSITVPRNVLTEQNWEELFELESSLRASGGLVEFAYKSPIADWTKAHSFDASKRRLLRAAPGDGLLSRLTGDRLSSYLCDTQKSAVRAAVTAPCGSVLLVSMPTGSGKSLVFQLAVLRARELAEDHRPVGVVIVPTVALAHSHVHAAQRIPGLERSSALTGSMSYEERTRVLQEFGAGDVPLLFLSPEIAMRGDCLDTLQRVSEGRPSRHAPVGKLTHFVVDEVHIVESWGRTFRPDFQRLHGFIQQLRSQNSSLRAILLSATIGARAHNLLKEHYGSPESPYLEVSAVVPRYEFDIFVDQVSSKEEQVDLFLGALARLPRPLVVYTTQIKSAVDVHSRIERCGFGRSAVMTGDTSGIERERIVKEWSRGELDIVVGTAAFGMGIDKPNVRAVVHLCVPEDAARYYQEIGRGGRDGHMALAWCVWTMGDLAMARSLVSGQLLGDQKAKLRWAALVSRAKRSGTIDVSGHHPVLDIDLETAHDGLGEHTGDQNINWNRSLLNQLQRAGATRTRGVAEDRDHWSVEVLDTDLLGANPDNALSVYLAHRHSEARATRADTDHFISLIEEGEGLESYPCFLAEVFEAVESQAPDPTPCGRCHWCRKNCLDAPGAQTARGMSSRWSNLCAHETRVYVVHPEDEDRIFREVLINRMVSSGVQQFVVPRTQVPWAVSKLSMHAISHGLVLEHERVFDEPEVLAHLPTALVLDALRQPHEFLERLAQIVRSEILGQPLLVVSAPRLRIEGRPIADVLSKMGPLDEAQLEHMKV